MGDIEELREVYEQRRDIIEKRLGEFEKVGQRSFRALFRELVFCLLTPMSRAKSCDAAVKRLQYKDLLFKGDEFQIAEALEGVRFPENKARFIVEAGDLFMGPGGYNLERIIKENTRAKVTREWFVKNVKGLGYKESSHFLRNVGIGFDLAILDRHILRNLYRHEVIKEIPQSMTKKQYLEIEKKMRKFSKDIGIEMGALDLLFWSMETGEVFK
ncbi:MAG: N-glycosylase/DNA lyase [Thermoplasmata archaeon]|nr:N-glycosylase/DNA lyase [Thermoplasmata archaeon]